MSNGLKIVVQDHLAGMNRRERLARLIRHGSRRFRLHTHLHRTNGSTHAIDRSHEYCAALCALPLSSSRRFPGGERKLVKGLSVLNLHQLAIGDAQNIGRNSLCRPAFPRQARPVIAERADHSDDSIASRSLSQDDTTGRATYWLHSHHDRPLHRFRPCGSLHRPDESGAALLNAPQEEIIDLQLPMRLPAIRAPAPICWPLMPRGFPPARSFSASSIPASAVRGRR